MYYITISTDGSGTKLGNPGGAAAILRSHLGHYSEASDGRESTTNNEMELLAILIGLAAVRWRGCAVLIRSDSQVALGWASGRTDRSGRAYATELGAAIDGVIATMQLAVTFTHIKGHSGDLDNERAHTLANQVRVGMLNSGARLHTDTGLLAVPVVLDTTKPRKRRRG